MFSERLFDRVNYIFSLSQLSIKFNIYIHQNVINAIQRYLANVTTLSTSRRHDVQLYQHHKTRMCMLQHLESCIKTTLALLLNKIVPVHGK